MLEAMDGRNSSFICSGIVSAYVWIAVYYGQVWSLGQEDPLEEGIATQSSITEEPGGL